MDKIERMPMTCEDFIALQTLRMIKAIPETDPTTNQFAYLLENIERFGAAATGFADIWKWMDSYFDVKEGKQPVVKQFSVVSVEETPDEPEEEPTEEPAPDDEASKFGEPAECAAYDAATVKKAIGKARADGKLDKISAWLMENFGVDGFNALPATKYGEAMAKLKDMGVEV